MKCIVGLGNPGEGYLGTRHNVGFSIVSQLAHHWGVSFQYSERFKANLASDLHGSEKVLLVKPTTYYNLSGEAVQSLSHFYKFDPADILVIHDELALPLGTVRARYGGSDAGNNGIKSLNQHLGPDYARLRVGIANQDLGTIAAQDFVLGRLSADEQALLHDKLFPIIEQYVEQFLSGKLTADTSVHQ